MQNLHKKVKITVTENIFIDSTNEENLRVHQTHLAGEGSFRKKISKSFVNLGLIYS